MSKSRGLLMGWTNIPKRLAQAGSELMGGTSAQANEFIRADVEG